MESANSKIVSSSHEENKKNESKNLYRNILIDNI